MRCTNTKALIEAVHSYPVDFISHPDLMAPVDLDELAPGLRRHGNRT